MRIVKNPHRGHAPLMDNVPMPSIAAHRVTQLLSLCPAASQTPLRDITGALGTGEMWVKDERSRMNLGSFKALGAAYVIACHATETGQDLGKNPLSGRTYVTASAGNHGLSVAAGARIFGAKAVIYLSQTVPDAFAERLASQGAQVVRAGSDYAASMEAAQTAAVENVWTLLSDSSWEGYMDLPHTLMEGYTQMAAEIVEQCPDVPTHIFLQAGVGGLAGAVAAYCREAWGNQPVITVVEPTAAPALMNSIEAGACVFADGPDSSMGRLDCKEPSLIALNGLARDADFFVTLEDARVEAVLPLLAEHDLNTSPSGAAGLAAALEPEICAQLGIDARSKVMCILSEGPA